MVAGEQGGGPDRTAEVLARNYRQLRGVLCRSLSRRLDLTTAEFDELYQEAWRDIVKRAQDGEPIRNYRAFVTGVMINKWKMELRSRRRHPTVPLDASPELADGPLHPGESPAPQPAEDRVDLKERARLALELIEAVSDPRRRKVLELRLACELSAGEVQRKLGVTERTYRRLLTEAMHDIDAMLELVQQGKWCENRHDLIVAYAEGRADDDQVAQAKRHLRSCPPCRGIFAAARERADTSAARRVHAPHVATGVALPPPDVQ
jgi:RNA polymerase sigma factor (sigma-70 family)